MTVKIITDSSAGIPAQTVEELGITVIPALVCFGEESYRDGIDMTTEQFYERLTHDKIHPTTSVPTPPTFAEAYDNVAEAETLAERLNSKFSKERIYRSKVSPAVGVHVGPHVLAVSILGDRE
jgi:fatty acid-binding protein DegV